MLSVPLGEPLFILGTLFILVVLFVPGGLVGLGARLTSSRSRAGRPATAAPGEDGA